MEKIVALDLFAGTGWGVACKRLGIEEYGVELMDEAVATRTANGMETVYRDVWDGLLLDAEAHALLYGTYNLLIASPPCQTFSAAGNGAGRRALNGVLEAITLEAYKDPAALLAFGEKHDPRTALVLTPLAYVWRDRPALVALEQVPTVQPVWDAYAEVMRGWGYSVETRVLNAEQYGVPQTRRRAILVAHLDGPVSLPTPTHSRYYSRTPEKLDPGVKKWVSMAEALGWGRTDAPVHTVTAGTHGPTDRWASGGKGVRRTMDEASRSEKWIRKPGLEDAEGRTQYAERFGIEEVSAIQTYPVILQNGNQPNATRRHEGTPAPTICFGHNASRIEWVTPEQAENVESSGNRITVEEAAALQSYPVARKNMGAGMIDRHGDRPVRPANSPAFTIRASAGGTEPGGFVLEDSGGSTRKLDTEEVAALQSYPTGRGLTDRPSPTITGGGTETGCAEPIAKYHERYTSAPGWQGGTERLSTDEAAALQSYPGEPPFIWCGTKSKVFLQIGNAVPPLLAQHILAALVQAHEAADLI